MIEGSVLKSKLRLPYNYGLTSFLSDRCVVADDMNEDRRLRDDL